MNNIHHRKSIRLQEYDYSQEGAYYVTICTKNRECLFGKIVEREDTRYCDLTKIGEKMSCM